MQWWGVHSGQTIVALLTQLLGRAKVIVASRCMRVGWGGPLGQTIGA